MRSVSSCKLVSERLGGFEGVGSAHRKGVRGRAVGRTGRREGRSAKARGDMMLLS